MKLPSQEWIAHVRRYAHVAYVSGTLMVDVLHQDVDREGGYLVTRVGVRQFEEGLSKAQTFRRRRRALGVCVYCGGAHRGGHDGCITCRRARAGEERARYQATRSHAARLARAVLQNWFREGERCDKRP